MNSVKLQETERALLGQRGAVQAYSPRPRSRELFDGLTPFGLAKGDMVENMVARIRRVAAALALVAPLVGEMIARVTANDTVYRRFEAARQALPAAAEQPRPLLGEPGQRG